MTPVPRRSPTASVAAAPLAAALLAALLAGCSILPEKTEISLFAPDPRVQADPAWPTVSWQLVIPRPAGAALVDSARIAVRPAPGELQVYKTAAWTQPALDLVHDAVLHAFEDSGRIAGVARRGEGLNADYQLLLDVRRFDSDYAEPGGPAAVVEVGAKLLADDSDQVVASRVFRHAVPAAATDVGSVAEAFEAALSGATRDIVGWTLAEGQSSGSVRPAPDGT
jgi:cholesterol transport system auxiliary component